MIKIEYAENFQEFDKLADELLDEYDSKNGYHASKFFNEFQNLATNFKKWL